MKTEKSWWRRCSPGVALAVGCLVSILPARADVVKTGSNLIPGHPGKTLIWRAGYSKSPFGNPVGAKSIHFWYDLKLDAPLPGDDVRFVICAMINVNGAKFDQPAYRVDLVENQWRCRRDMNLDGTDKVVNWYPNYHFGCKRIRLWAGNNWHDNISFDKTVTLTVPFTEKDLVAPYIDIARDCPGGFVECKKPDGVTNVFPGTDLFMTPGTGNFPQPGDPFPGSPDGTSSWWIVTRGVDIGVIQSGSGGWNAGNWYTMAFPQNTYRSSLDGILSNAPAGTLVEFSFPPSTQGGVQRFRVTGVGCFGNPLEVSIPFLITEGLMRERDENINLRFDLSQSECPQYPSGEVIEFLGQATATDFSFFPDGSVLYAPGDFMHGIHAQFVADRDLPFVVNQQLRQIPGSFNFEISVAATDDTTMAIGATLRLNVNGQQLDDFPIPFDDPSERDGVTFFRGVVGPIRPGSRISYEILLVDDAGNVSTTPGTPVVFASPQPAPAAVEVNGSR